MLDDQVVRVLVLSRKQLQAVVDGKPTGFGEHPEKYHRDAIFLMGAEAADALPAVSPREGIDRIMASPLYYPMTIRNWNTTVKLAGLLKDMDSSA
jgi:uncharacterized protein (DUF1697 family)